MPKISQTNVSAFYFAKGGDVPKVRQFIDTNHGILAGFLLVFDEIDAAILPSLEAHKLNFIERKNLLLRGVTPNVEAGKIEAAALAKIAEISKTEVPKIAAKSVVGGESSFMDSPDSRGVQNATKIIEKLIRSGECVESRGDLVILQRVNSGASVESRGNVVILGVCEGDVVCEGEFMILSKIAQGKVRFRGEQIAPSALKYALNLITIEENALKIRDVLGLAGC